MIFISKKKLQAQLAGAWKAGQLAERYRPGAASPYADGDAPEVEQSVCPHQWQVTSASFQPPTTRRFESWGFTDPALIRRLLLGLTTVTQQCTRCEKVESYTVAGRAQLPGLNWRSA